MSSSGPDVHGRGPTHRDGTPHSPMPNGPRTTTGSALSMPPAGWRRHATRRRCPASSCILIVRIVTNRESASGVPNSTLSCNAHDTPCVRPWPRRQPWTHCMPFAHVPYFCGYYWQAYNVFSRQEIEHMRSSLTCSPEGSIGRPHGLQYCRHTNTKKSPPPLHTTFKFAPCLPGRIVPSLVAKP